MCLSVSLCQWEVGRTSGKLKHSPAQRKTALHSCGPWWRHSWLKLWTQSGPTRTARVPRRNYFPATQKSHSNVRSINRLREMLWTWILSTNSDKHSCEISEIKVPSQWNWSINTVVRFRNLMLQHQNLHCKASQKERGRKERQKTGGCLRWFPCHTSADQ